MPKVNIAAKLTAASAVALLALTACSSSKSTSGPSSSTSGSSSTSNSGTGQPTGTPIKVGVITDTTGAASSGYTNTEKGIKAYVDGVNGSGGVNGHKLEYVMGDSQSTPGGALTAAQKLVQTDKVFAIISVTSDMFGAEPYLLKAGVPVIGTGFDGPEWTVPSNTNMFDGIGVANPSAVFTSLGDAVKQIGGTTCGALGYIESPSASKSAAAFPKSCVAAGLKAGLVDNISFGSTDVAPVALAMKGAGVDSIFFATVPSTGFALAAALRTVGVQTKAIILPNGYGADLLGSSAGIQAAQGFYFTTGYAPVETNTPATQVLKQRLAAAGEPNPPGYAESTAYLSMATLAAGITAAGSDVSQKNFMASLRKVTDFNADGLLSPGSVNFSDYDPSKSCGWYLKLEGKQFVPVQGLAPICGTKISG